MQEARDSFSNGVNRSWTITSGTAKSFTQTDVDTWLYRVRAYNDSLAGAWSNTVSVSVVPPGAPDGLNASPSSTDTGRITVDWNTASGRVTKYLLQEARDSFSNGVNRSWTITSGTTKSFTQADTGTWRYRVRAYNDDDPGAWSSTDTVYVVRPGALAKPVLESKVDLNYAFEVSWNSGGSHVDRYDLRMKVNDLPWQTIYSGSNRSHYEDGHGTGDYQVEVRVCKATGCSPWSNALSFSFESGTIKCPPICIDPLSEPSSGTDATTAQPGSGGSEPAPGGTSPASGTAVPEPGSTAAAPRPPQDKGRLLDADGAPAKGFRLMAPARPYDLARRTAGVGAPAATSATTPVRWRTARIRSMPRPATSTKRKRITAIPPSLC